jgi:ABC-type Fe3+-hydroxamate transport system substrate-binding protein
MRVISLVPSITETLLSWDVEPIACTKYCEQPTLTHVGGTKNPDVDAIVELAPDVVLMDRIENRREDADDLTRRGVRVMDIDVRTLADVGPELDTLARAVGVESPAIDVPAPGPITRTAFIPIWRRPWMTSGPQTYGSTLLASIGVGNVFDDAETDFPEVELADVAARRPDLVLVPSEPYDFRDAHLDELAVIEATIIEVDGQDLFWWGARTAVAIERLGRVLSGPEGGETPGA